MQSSVISNKIFPLGVAYHPDYIYEDNLVRTSDGTVKKLSVNDQIIEDFLRMKRLGIKWIRVGEFSWKHVEPRDGEIYTERFDFVLDQALKNDIDVIFCTPTATPPKWVIDKYPEILPVMANGEICRFGGRRHYDPSSERYISETKRICEIYTKSFGSHKAVKGWQVDNELGNEGTAFHYSDSALAYFRKYLENKYEGDFEKLNREWFNCFWSQGFNSFDEIEFPWENIYSGHNISMELEFNRCMTDLLVSYQKVHVEIMKKNSPGRFIIHNHPPILFDLDWYKMSEDLDFVGYDHYQMESSPNPIASTSMFNLMRSLKGGKKFMILEQQPLQVNWQDTNPRYNMDWLFLWGAQSAFLGASSMYYFSWRRFQGGGEQYHDAVVSHDVRVPESQQEKVIVGKQKFFSKIESEFKLTSFPNPDSKALVIHNIESLWTHTIAAQSAAYVPTKEIDRVQNICSSLGIGIDFCSELKSSPKDLTSYDLVILPGYAFELKDDEISILKEYLNLGGKCLSLPRTGMKKRNNQMSEMPLRLFEDSDFYFEDFGALLPNEIEKVESINGKKIAFDGVMWAEKLKLVNQNWYSVADFTDGLYKGSPAVIQNSSFKNGGSYTHFAVCPTLSQEFSAWLSETLELDCEVILNPDHELQLFPLEFEGRSFRAFMNFSNSLIEVDLTKFPTGTMNLITGRLDDELCMNLDKQLVKLDQKVSKLKLQPWSVGFSELLK